MRFRDDTFAIASCDLFCSLRDSGKKSAHRARRPLDLRVYRMYPSRSSPPPSPSHSSPPVASLAQRWDTHSRLPPSHHQTTSGAHCPPRLPCVNTKNVRLPPRFCPPPPRPFSPPGTLWVPGTAPGKRLCICLWQYFSPSVFPISVVITRGAMRRMWGQPSPHRIRSLHYPWTLGSIYVSVPTVPFPWFPSLPQSPLLFG